MNLQKMKIIAGRRAAAFHNMKRDRRLFDQAEAGQLKPTLRFYSWKGPSISYGYGLKPQKYLDLSAYQKKGWTVVKRPTGGGIVFHQINDISFSLVASLTKPAGQEHHYYIKILAEGIRQQLKQLGIEAELVREGREQPRLQAFCFSHLEKFEIVVRGKKLVGFGQKIGRRSVLVQGNLLVDPPPDRPETREKAISLSQILGRTISFDEARGIIYNAASAWPKKENAPASPSKIF